MSEYFLTSEAVAEGHPDKLCDQIADTILDVYLARDAMARTAIEVLATTNQVVLAGEVSSVQEITKEEADRIVRSVVKEIGYEQSGFHYKNLNIDNFIHSQSPDIIQGVEHTDSGEICAGDQGIMFGYAVNEVEGADFMPASYYYANKILRDVRKARLNGIFPFLRPDGKAQVTFLYQDGKPVKIAKLVVSSQHDKEVSSEQVQDALMQIIDKCVPSALMPDKQDIFINPTGRFVIGGPNGDTGLTGRKIVVDSYGGGVPHGGGAFSGKDATKVDRSGAYMTRYMAKNVVAAGLADKCLIQVAYAIGIAKPMSLLVNTFGSGKVDDEKLTAILSAMFDLTPKGIIETLDLRKPIFRKTSAYGHFGRTPEEDGSFSWEKTDKVQDLQNAV